MKYLFVVHRTVRSLALPLAIAISIMLAGSGSARAGNKSPVEVGFVSAPDPNFQNVMLNVQAVRINPNVGAAPNNPKWQKILVPSGIGGNLGGAGPELQIDLNTSQNVPQLFNTARVRPDTYRIAELFLDPNQPGTLVPNCPQAGSLLEGCINYQFQLSNPGAPITVTAPTGSTLVSPRKGRLAQLVLQVRLKVITAPIGPRGTYFVEITLNPVTTSTLGTVMGTLPTGSGSTGKQVRPLSVTAETIGTNTAIASSAVDPTTGQYTLLLPAASNFGTYYDLAVAGGMDSFAGVRLPALFPDAPNNLIIQNFTKLLTGQPVGNIEGTITDECTAKPIVGATVQLLIPPLNNPNVTEADCLDPVNYRQCVSVATAATGPGGNFPLPGTLLTPAAFSAIPILPSTAKVNTYAMMVTAPGYDNFFTPANANTGRGLCGSGETTGACNLALSTGFINGSLAITPPLAGQTTMVQVFAEDTGTNNIVSALPMPVIARSTSGGVINFTINVPTEPSGGRTFDLFASTIDSFQGLPDPYNGHTIAVIPDILGPTPPTGPGACDTVTAPISSDTLDCVGHGSITGAVGGADLGSSVQLAKKGVALTNTAVQNVGGTNSGANSYSFCVPGGDTYTVQRFELPTPPTPIPTATSTVTATPTPPLIAPTPAPAGAPTDVTVPLAQVVGGPTPTPSPTATSTGGPTPTSTPTPSTKCPTTCSNTKGSCPGVCGNVIENL